MVAEVHQFLQVLPIIVIVLTTLPPPFLLKWLHARYPHKMRQPEAG